MFFPCFNWRIILNYQWISPNLAMFSHLWAATSWLRDWCPAGWQWNGPVALKVLQPSGPSAAIGAPRPQGDTPWCPHLKKRWKITWWWQVQFFGLNLFWVCFFLQALVPEEFWEKTCWTTLRTTLNHMADQNSLAFLQRPTMMPSHSWQILHTQKTSNVYSSTSYST